MHATRQWFDHGEIDSSVGGRLEREPESQAPSGATVRGLLVPLLLATISSASTCSLSNMSSTVRAAAQGTS
ncbi:hypothetical protein FHW64_006398 [Variovorax sp. Sphag1AA]|nr:hypothetical protein [Variovorax sp. Sphag1AA]